MILKATSSPSAYYTTEKASRATALAEEYGLPFAYYYDYITAWDWYRDVFKDSGKARVVTPKLLLEIYFLVNEWRIKYPGRTNEGVYMELEEQKEILGKDRKWTWWRDNYSRAEKWLKSENLPYPIVEQLSQTVKKYRMMEDLETDDYHQRVDKKGDRKIRDAMKKIMDDETYRAYYHGTPYQKR